VSDSARPDLAAFRELEQLIRALGDEMAAWRRRAHEAESQLKATEARLARLATQTAAPAATGEGAAPAPATAHPASAGSSGQLVAALQRENQELKLRLEAARQRTKQLLERVRFLRQQHEIGSAER
jgi:predicted  nucleic acid-binding Zn-ribbon protein